MSQQDIYEKHHSKNRERGFSILKEERGELLKRLIGTGKEVLDIGCRDGALTKFFLERNEVLGVDVDERALDEARKLGIKTLNMDLLGDWRELEGRQFDAAVLGEVLEHLYYPAEVLRKIKAHLKPRGTLYGSVPNAFSLKNRLRYLMGRKKHTPLSDPTHINHFSLRDLKMELRKQFNEVEIIGLGKHTRLAGILPNLCAFDLFFIARN